MSSPTATTLAAALLLLLGSCATVFTGSEDTVKILSDPPGATFTTNTGVSGVTPSEVRIPEDLTLEVSYSLDGYEARTVHLEPRLSAWIAGNLLAAGLFGVGIDLATGQWRTHASEVSVALRPLAQPPAARAPATDVEP